MDFLRQTIGNTLSWLRPKVNQDSQILSKAAYDPGSFEKDLQSRGYTRDVDLSNEDAQVYVKDGKAHVAYRGTSKFKDLAPDLDIALGKRKHRDFDSAIETANRAKTKYGNAKLVGHSLGGTKAIHVAERLGLEAEVYNPGSSPFKPTVINNQKITVYKNPFDIISSGIKGKSVRWWRNPYRMSVHGI